LLDREDVRALPTTTSDEFWAEALRLADIVNEAKGEVAKRGVEVIQLLAGQEAGANPQVRAVKEKNSLYIKRGGDLTNDFGELLQVYRTEREFYITSWQQVLEGNRRVDAQKIANRELLDRMAQATKTMASTPEAIQTLVGAAAITQYSQFLYYVDLLNAFLQYPTKFRSAMDAAGTLANAAVMDLAGTVFPFAGTVTAAIDTIFDLKEPRINKKIEELRQAADILNRVADFGDQLTELLDYADFTKDVIRLADGTLETTHASFAIHAVWLSTELENAERDDDGIS
jgi:hypothetical protein